MTRSTWRFQCAVLLLASIQASQVSTLKRGFFKKNVQLDPKVIAYENLVNKTKERILDAFQDSERKGIQASMELSSKVQGLTSVVFDNEYTLIKDLKAIKKELVETSQSHALKSVRANECVHALNPDKALKDVESALPAAKKCMRKLKESSESLEIELTKTIIQFRSYAMQTRSAVGKCQLARDRPPNERCLNAMLEESVEMMEALPYRIIHIKHKAKQILDAFGQNINSCRGIYLQEKARALSLLKQIRQCES